MTDANVSQPNTDLDKIDRYFKACHALLASQEPITLPNYRTLTFKEAEDIAAFVKAGDRRKASILFMSHVLLNNNRASRLTYYYSSCAPIKDLTRILESATLAVFQENYVAAYMTLMPVIEGTILRWSGHKAIDKKPSFSDQRQFIADKITEVREKIDAAAASENLKAISKRQLEYLGSVIDGHLFRTHLSRISDFNRHIALHLIDKPSFCNSLNVANLFVLFDNLVDAIHWDLDTYGAAWGAEFSDTSRDARRLYNLFFEAASKWPEPHFRLAQDLNFLNDDYFAQWFADARRDL